MTIASDLQLRVTEVFYSLQGESSWAGLPTVFVRLTGCPLRCHYCDTAYAFNGGELLSIGSLLAQVARFDARYVCVTGGEPLAQPGCVNLLEALCDDGYQVSLETSGAMDIAAVDSRVKRIVDLKTPASGEQGRNLLANIEQLRGDDELKFVICDRADYDWSAAMLREHDLAARVGSVLFSPANSIGDDTPACEPLQLAQWILQDQLPVRMQLQMHKLIWGNEPGH